MTKTRKILFCLIIGALVFEVSKFYSYFQEYSSWQYADWLINYQGGLVRRGLIGEILFQFHKIFLINLDILIFFFVIFLYLVLSYFLIKSVKYIEDSRTNILIFLSPGFFLYPVMNSEVVGRKDILLIALISSFVFLEEKISKKYHFIILILTILLLSFSHSGFIFYMPYFIFLYILIKNKNDLKLNVLEIIITFSTLLLSILFIKFFNGSEFQIKKICESVKEFYSNNCGKADQIFWLSNSVKSYFYEKFKIGENFLRNYFIIYSISIVLVFLFVSIKLINSKFREDFLNIKKYNPLLIILFLFLFTIPVYILGRDWGRYIYISYSSTFFLYIYCVKNNILIFKKKKFFCLNNLNKSAFVILVIFYSFFWTFPFYDAKSFKLVLKKPIYSLIKKN